MNSNIDKSDEGSGLDSTSTQSSSGQKEVEDVLANFREMWQKELRSSPKRETNTVNINNKNFDENEDFENKARNLFTKGIEMEKAGKLYEAIQFYRRAVQIVPDIEFKLDNLNKTKIRDNRHVTEQNENVKEADILCDSNTEETDSDEEDIKEGELLARIQRKLAKAPLCVLKFEQKTAHISQLPVEIILYILRWVVSGDLDLRSLEAFSSVCRGFYLCARDQEIWRLACLRVWGLNCGPDPGIYESWRLMYIERPRIHFNGCYISKTTYIRHGENSFQDQFYRPWHLVAYYRYFRFFPEGTVLMLTSSEDPTQCVGLMKSRTVRPPVLSGYYRLKDDKVTLVIHNPPPIPHGFKRNPKRKDHQENAEQTFHMELQIKSYDGNRHVKLVWTHYSVFQKNKRGDESTCNFDLRSNRFPPFWFSRVKSYTAETETILS